MIESDSSGTEGEDEIDEISEKLPNGDAGSLYGGNTNENINRSNSDSISIKGSIKNQVPADNISLSSAGSPKHSLSRRSLGGRFRTTKHDNITSSQSSLQYVPDNSGGAAVPESAEDTEHRKLLQLYVFVARCIAYPFNARQPTDMARRQSKVTKANLIAIKERFTVFLDGKTNIIADEAFKNAVQSYTDTFLRSDRVAKMVNSGGYSSNDFREIFKANIEKRVRMLPDIEGLSKETVLASWMAKFDAIYRGDDDQKRTPSRLGPTATSELILSKEQLYEMFQTILGIKKFEHQILYNACQLENQDEQAALIRRELHQRQKLITNLSKENMPKFIHKNMEEIYVEEKKAQLKAMMAIHLETFPITKGGTDEKKKLYQMKKAHNSQVISMMDVNDDSDALLSKSVSNISFNLQVTIIEASGLNSLPGQRSVFVVMELEGDEKLSTETAEASRPVWETQGEWTTLQPLPLLKLKLMAEDSSLLHLSDEKTIAEQSITPHCGMGESHEWYKMTPRKGWSGEEIQLKLSIKMEKPTNIKKSGFLYAKGQLFWKTWKRRYFMLIQVSQYKFVLCSYRVKKQTPKEIMCVEGYTVDFADKTDDCGEGGRYFFNLVKAGDEVMFATDEDSDRQFWIHKIFQATGQQFQPRMDQSRTDQAFLKVKGDMDRAVKHGLAELVTADAFSFNQAELFSTLQRLTLLHRLNDSYTCLGWFSPGQVFVQDEFVARYDVRGCHRHLCYLADLLERAENSIMIDPTLLHYSYAFCASHVVGNRPDGVNTVTVDERDRFESIKERLKAYLANQITHFRYCFPFGRPEGALKSTLTLFERVLSKDTMSPAADPEDCDDVKEAIRACLRKAALVNYTRISKFAKVEESFHGEATPKEKLEIILQLAELCIELIQQNEEHHAEALAWYHDLVIEHTEIFWSLFAVDMDDALKSQVPDTWDSFTLFQMLNNYLRIESPLRGGKFHKHLTDKFAPQIVRYIDLMESSIARSVNNGFLKETYQQVGKGCAVSEEIFWKLQSIQAFILDLHWPDETFADHMTQRLRLMSADMAEAIVTRTLDDFAKELGGSVHLEYIVPEQACVMINVICDAHENSNRLCSVEDTNEPAVDEYRYHPDIDMFIRRAQIQSMTMIVEKLRVVLQDMLKKLARYDHGTITSKLFSFVKTKDEAANEFYKFIVMNTRQFREVIDSERYVFGLEKALWESLCQLLRAWLVERQEVPLHVYQFKILTNIVEPCRNFFEQEGLSEADLENDDYKAAYSKLQLEEAMLNLSETSILTREIEVKSYESQIQGAYSDYEEEEED